MKNVVRITTQGTGKDSEARDMAVPPELEEVETTVALIPLGLQPLPKHSKPR